MGVGLLKTFSGGMLDNVVAEIKTAKYAEWEYPNSTQGPVPCALIGFLPEDSEDVKEEAYTLGGTVDNWRISADGKTVDSLRTKEGKEAAFSEKSKWGRFVKALSKCLVEQKLPTDWATDDITSLIGLKVNLVQVESGGKGTGKGEVRTMAVPDEVISLPGKGATATSSANSGLEAKAVAIITDIIGDSGAPRSSLATKIFTMMKSDPDKNGVAGLITKDAFMNKNFNILGGIVYKK
jgi:hypothetical protein